MSNLADAVLPLVRTRADISRWGASNAHGRQMHEAVDILEAAIPTTATYRARLSDLETGLGTRPLEDRWTSRHSHEWFVIDWNARRLAVFDRDIDAIIRTHARDGKLAAWLEDTAEAFEEIGEIDLAIEWAKQATDFDHGHQALKAGRILVRAVGRAPTCGAAPAPPGDIPAMAVLKYSCLPLPGRGASWPIYRDEVVATLAASPRHAVLFALLTLEEVEFAWNLAHSLALEDDDVWERLAAAYENADPLAVLAVLARLVDYELTQAGARHYQIAAHRLAKMRKLASGTDEVARVNELIAELRETHRRRPRLQHEFDRAGLPRT